MKKISNVSISLVMSCLASQVFAAGFQIQEQNVTNLGLAYSGTAALAEDASTGFYNPAGLTRMGESQIVLSGVLIQGNFDFAASNSNVTLSPNTPVVGDQTDNPGTIAAVPAMYIAKRIDDRWVFGFNVTTPFGLHTKYQETGIARYLATESELQTLDFSPNIAYEILPCLSIGAGFDAVWVKAVLEARTGAGQVPFDGFQKNRAEGWGYTFHGGLLWSIYETTRLGLNYRARVNFDVDGNSQSLAPILGAGTDGLYVIRTVRSQVTLPETATFSFYHAFDDRFAVTGDVAWTNWSRFHTLRLRFEPNTVDTDTWEHFKDSWRYALGLIYTHDDCWLFRVGGAYEQTPVRDELRTARIPDNDRIWAAIGGAYTVSENLRIDFGYAHIFFDDASIDDHGPFLAQTAAPPAPPAVPLQFRTRLVGEYEGSANIVGIQIRYDFV